MLLLTRQASMCLCMCCCVLLPCSALFTSEDFQQWRGAFYERLKQHVAAASKSIGELLLFTSVPKDDLCIVLRADKECRTQPRPAH
jgi:hypothetical protein